MLFLLIVVVTAAGGLMPRVMDEVRRRYTPYEMHAASMPAV
jgi:hypothetical protein